MGFVRVGEICTYRAAFLFWNGCMFTIFFLLHPINSHTPRVASLPLHPPLLSHSHVWMGRADGFTNTTTGTAIPKSARGADVINDLFKICPRKHLPFRFSDSQRWSQVGGGAGQFSVGDVHETVHRRVRLVTDVWSIQRLTGRIASLPRLNNAELITRLHYLCQKYDRLMSTFNFTSNIVAFG